MQVNRIRERLRQGKLPFGAAVQLNSPWIVEMCAYAGYDYVLLDAEHGAAAYGLPELIVSAQAAGISPVVRVPSQERGFILPSLEAGAGGIWFPMVETAEQARRLVEEVKYEPLGRRGFSLATRAARFGSVSREEHIRSANQEVLLIVTLESLEALRNAADISKVPGIDLLFIGRDDLTEALGAKDRDDSLVRQAVCDIVASVEGRVPVGTTAFSAEDVAVWQSEGIRFFLTGTTRTIQSSISQVYRELVSGLRA